MKRRPTGDLMDASDGIPPGNKDANVLNAISLQAPSNPSRCTHGHIKDCVDHH